MTTLHPPRPDPSHEMGGNPHVHHEHSDINFRAVLMSALGLVGATPLILLLVWLLFGYLTTREDRQIQREFPLAAQQENRLPPEPRLQTNPRQDLDEFRAAEHEILTTYGWVDRNAGIVRIPVEEAMKLVVQRGLGARQEKK